MTLVPPPTGDGAIWNVWLAAFHAPTLAVADELGVFAALDRQPMSAGELAGTLTIEHRAIESMLGLLAALGFLARTDARFRLTEVARHYLLPASPYYWGGFLARIRTIPIDCGKLVASLRRGTAAAEARVSGQLWRAPTPPAEALVGFTHAMHAHSFALAIRAVPMLELSAVTRLLDVAGGSGSYSIAAADRHASLRCTVLDLEPVCAVSEQYIAKLGAADRVTTHAADMFVDPWPGGHDAVFMADIFHDWDDERCLLLAQRAFDALPPGGRLLVHEMILADTKDAPLNAIAYSMVMVFVTEGRQRTGGELVEILTRAGFMNCRIAPTLEGYALVSGTRPG